MKEESPSNINLPSNIGSPESPACLKPSSSSTTINNKEQDRFLPIANVGRIMKKVMPANGKISKDAKETVQECVSEFISFVTGEASDKCQREKRKTINGDDIIWAITILGFDDYVDPLKSYLQKYREIEGEKLNVPKQQHQQQQSMLHQHQHNNNIPNIINNNLSLNNSIYSSNPFISQRQPLPHPHPPYVTSDQTFSLPNFSTNSIQKQVQPQDNMDSMGQW